MAFLGNVETGANFAWSGVHSFTQAPKPATNDGAALGVVTSGEWSDMFMASGATINFGGTSTQIYDTGGTSIIVKVSNVVCATFNGSGTTDFGGGGITIPNNGSISFNAGDVTITHASNSLSFAGGTYTFGLLDNSSSAMFLSEGVNDYVAINTANGTESVSFGNALTNPVFSFLGSGLTTFAGAVDLDAGYKVAAAQSSDYYNTADEVTNYERVSFSWVANVFKIDTLKANAGTLRNLSLCYGGTPKITLDSGGVTAAARWVSTYGADFGDTVKLNDTVEIVLGTSYDSRLKFNTTQTANAFSISLLCGSNASSGHVLILNDDYRGTNYAHAFSVNPTVYIHSAASAATSTAQWLGLWHDQTNANIQTGLGDLILTIAGGNLAPAANDGWALGISGQAVSDVFLASGAVIDFNAAGATITHSFPGSVNTLSIASTVGYWTIGDNQGLAFQLQEAGNSYLGVSTSNGTEMVYFGNGTTNPAFQFQGTGYTSFGGNVGVGTSTFGASAAKVLALTNGATAPTTSVDLVQLWAEDLSAGNATLGIYTETAVATESVAVGHTLSIRINGATRKMLLD